MIGLKQNKKNHTLASISSTFNRFQVSNVEKYRKNIKLTLADA